VILKRLALRNYRKFRELEVDLPEGLVAIVGRNGMGKSTLIEAVAFALYGTDASRTRARGVRREGARPSEPCSVTLEFTLHNEPYRIVRRLTGVHEKQDVALYHGSEPTPRATQARAVQEEMRRLLGMDYLTFTRSVLARQKEVNVLSEARPEERRKAVRKMLGIEAVRTAMDRARAELRDTSQRFTARQEALAALPELLCQEDVLRPMLLEVRRNAAEVARRAKAATGEAQAAERELRAWDAQRTAYEDLSQELKGVEVALDAGGKALQELQAQVATSEQAEAERRALEPREREFQQVSRKKEQLDQALGQHQGRVALEKQLQRLERAVAALDAKLEEARTREAKGAELPEARRSASEALKGLKLQLRARERAALEGQKALERADTRLQAARERVRTLREVGASGGECPTCLQKLGTSYRAAVKALDAEARAVEQERKAQALQTKQALEEAAAAKADVTRAEGHLQALEVKLTRHAEDARAVRALVQEREGQREQLKAQRAELKRLTAVRYDAAEHRALTKQLTGLRRLHDRFERMGQEAGHLPGLQERRKEAEGGLRTLRRRQARLEQQRGALGFEPERYRAAQARRERASEQERTAQAAHTDASRMLATCEEQARQLHERITALEQDARKLQAEREELRYLETVVGLLNAFQAELITRVKPALEESASELLNQMTRGRYPQLSLDDDYEISLHDGGQAHPLERFSGGEEDLANLCLRIAISQLVGLRAGADTSSMLVLDEVFGSQDAERRERILGALHHLQGIFQQVLLITHLEDVHERVPHMLRVSEDATQAATVALA
jgi:exonuclease SbcC